MTADHGLVLAVDDEAIILWGTAVLLESLGYRVVKASTAASALKALREQPDVDVLLTDFQMPEMSGVELATAARAVRPHLAVIITSGNADLQRGAGCEWATMAKPFTRDDLAEAIKAVRVHH